MEEHGQGLSGVREVIAHFEQRVDRRFEAVDRRFDAIDRRFEAIGDILSRHFMWLVGIQITTLVAIVAALISRG